MDNKAFERAILSAIYDALDSQGVEIPENVAVEPLVGGSIAIKDLNANKIVSMIYVPKVIKNEPNRRNDVPAVQGTTEQNR
jgi:hypothetical protein